MANPCWHANELEKEIEQQENAVINQQAEQGLQEKAKPLLRVSSSGMAKGDHGVPEVTITYC